MSGGGNEPLRKKAKLDTGDPIDPMFKTFFEDKKRFGQLRSAVKVIKFGGQQRVIFRKIVESNARESVWFSKASCTLECYPEPGLVTIGAFFVPAIDILDRYCGSNPSIPVDQNLRAALSTLLNFLASDHGRLLYTEAHRESPKPLADKWAVMVAQHLLCQLAMVPSNTAMPQRYKIECYPHLSLEVCPCEKGDAIIGEKDDTSFGCEEGWHGRVDILMEDLAVQVPVQDDEDVEQSVTSVDEDVERSVSSVEIKASTAIISTENQLTAQAVAFSFLQRKYNKDQLKTCLVPALSVSMKNYQILCFDSEKDILVSTLPNKEETNLFDDTKKDLNYTAAVALWMVLNYRHLCSGVPTNSEIIELDKVRAEFFDRVGSYLSKYQEEVKRPVHASNKKSDIEGGNGKSMEQVFGKRSPDTDFVCLLQT